MISPDQILVGSYDHRLVGLSVVIAIFAWYAALGITWIVVVTLTLLGFAVISSLLDRRFSAEVKQRNELVTLLLDSAPEAIYGIDAKGDCTFCNRAFLRLMGYGSAAELQGK